MPTYTYSGTSPMTVSGYGNVVPNQTFSVPFQPQEVSQFPTLFAAGPIVANKPDEIQQFGTSTIAGFSNEQLADLGVWVEVDSVGTKTLNFWNGASREVVGNAEGLSYTETVADTSGFSVGQAVRKTSTGWAVSDYSAFDTARADGVIAAIPSSTSLVISGKGSLIVNSSATWVTGDIGFVQDNGAIVFVTPSGAGLWATPVISCLSSSVAIVLAGEPQPASAIALTELEEIPPQTVVWNPLIENAKPTANTLESFAAALTPLLDIPENTAAAPTEITGTVIDATVAPDRFKNITANTTFTLSNFTEGSRVRLYLSNTGSFTASITGTTPPNNTAPTLTASRTDIWDLVRANGVTYLIVVGAGYVLDTTAPTLTDFVIPQSEPGSIYFTKSEAIRVGSGGSGGWTISASGGAATVSSVDLTDDKLVCSRNFQSGETITVSYTNPGSGIEDMAGNDLGTISSASVSNLSDLSSYIVSEDFEGTGAPSLWTAADSGIDYDYTTSPAPLVGSQSLGIVGTAKYCTRQLGSTYTEAHCFFRVRIPTSSANNHIEFRNSSGQVQGRLTFRSSAVRIEHGGVSADSSGSAHANECVLWVEYIASFGSGSNGVMRLYINRNSTSETKPSLAASISTGTGGAIDRFSLISQDASTRSIWDKVRVASSPIGSSPA